MRRTPRVLAIDAGGTMTDTFVVDETGAFSIGKARTTPEDESIGFMRSSRDALEQWGTTVEAAFPGIRSGVYSGTAMLNRLLSRTGLRVGVIVTAGQEDALRMERAIQTYLGYSYGDRLHVATHFHNEPLVPRSRCMGVRGRFDVYGTEVLPLREEDVREAVRHLMAERVDAIVVSLLFSYRNGAHEEAVAEILSEELAAYNGGSAGDAVKVFLSSRLYPTRRDLPRLNSTLIEAYAAEPSRNTLRAVRAATREAGAEFELRVMSSHGGTVSIEADQLGTTLVSGPIGGVVGADWLAGRIDRSNILCTDIGGTSFDIALITDGRFEVTPTPDMARFVLNMPLVKIDSLGAGCGSYVRLDPSSGRPELGPESAGASIGVSWPEGGVETVTVTDLNLVLGRLNPEYFLGGEVDLDVERARHAIESQVSGPLGLPVEEGAAGVIDLFETTLRQEAVGRVLGKGYSPAEYTLLCYGGGGPLHVAGYTAGVPYTDVLVPAWAAGFSAFGCACADFEYRYDRSVDLPILPSYPPEMTAGMGAMITAAWRELEGRVAGEFAKSGYEPGQIEYTHSVRMQYYGQLNDIEIDSAVPALETADQVQNLIAAFEQAYGRLYAASAKSPELGYLVTQAVVRGRVPAEKPKLVDIPTVTGSPPVKGTRSVYWPATPGREPGFTETDIYAMEEVRNGHAIEGPAIIEAAATTFPIPPDRRVWIDRHDIFHLEYREDAR
ncbi:MAG: hydantoinase/oxoprolinase family protein [Solirubrobacterales bacterium]|nr:hydantoinase/oxoprolinase family protein [Solirubrobacterales bacterium]